MIARDRPHLDWLIEFSPVLDSLSRIAAFLDVVKRYIDRSEEGRLDFSKVPTIPPVTPVTGIAVAVRLAPLLIKPVLPGVDALHFREGLAAVRVDFASTNIALALELTFDLIKFGDVAAVGDLRHDTQCSTADSTKDDIEC